MVNFKLNISNLNNNINDYVKYQNSCIDDLNSIYNNLKNTDSGWNDSNSRIFISRAKRDKYKIDNYINKLSLIYKYVNTMNSSFNNLLMGYGYKSGSTIKYNDEYYQECITHLNNANAYLNSSLSYINSCRFKSNFSEIYTVYSVRSEIRKLKANINNEISKIKSFKNTVERILISTGNNIKRIGEFSLDIDELSYSWQVTNAVISSNETDSIAAVTANKSSIKYDYQNLNENILNDSISYVNNVVESSIESSATEHNNSYNVGTNINAYYANKNEINYNNENEIDGLNTGISSSNTTHENTINIDIDEYNNNHQLNNNIVSRNANLNKIDDNNNNEIAHGSLSYGVNNYNPPLNDNDNNE